MSVNLLLKASFAGAHQTTHTVDMQLDMPRASTPHSGVVPYDENPERVYSSHPLDDMDNSALAGHCDELAQATGTYIDSRGHLRVNSREVDNMMDALFGVLFLGVPLGAHVKGPPVTIMRMGLNLGFRESTLKVLQMRVSLQYSIPGSGKEVTLECYGTGLLRVGACTEGYADWVEMPDHVRKRLVTRCSVDMVCKSEVCTEFAEFSGRSHDSRHWLQANKCRGSEKWVWDPAWLANNVFKSELQMYK